MRKPSLPFRQAKLVGQIYHAEKNFLSVSSFGGSSYGFFFVKAETEKVWMQLHIESGRGLPGRVW